MSLSLTRWIAGWAIVGLLVAVAIMLAGQLQGGVFEWPRVMMVIWPSSILLMALEAVSQPWWWRIAVPAVAVALNVALYCIVGAVVLALAWRFARS